MKGLIEVTETLLQAAEVAERASSSVTEKLYFSGMSKAYNRMLVELRTLAEQGYVLTK